MKKIICLIFASVFYLLGIIGLIIPIIPQIPFLVIGTFFLIIGFKGIKEKIMKSNFYKQHLKKYVDKNNTLKKLFSEKDEINNSDTMLQ